MKAMAKAEETATNASSALISTTKITNSNNTNKLADSEFYNSDISKSKNNEVLNEKSIVVNQKAEIKSIKEKIEEKLNNNKFKEGKSNVNELPEKANLIDLNEIENKLNMSLNKNKEFLNSNNKSELVNLATEAANKKRSKLI
jgi:hypothetical protein